MQVWETLATPIFMAFVMGTVMYAGVGGAWLWWPRLCGECPPPPAQGGGGQVTREGQGEDKGALAWQSRRAAAEAAAARAPGCGNPVATQVMCSRSHTGQTQVSVKKEWEGEQIVLWVRKFSCQSPWD